MGRGLVVVVSMLVGLWIAAAYAEPEGGEEINCEQYFTLAESIMGARQKGVAMPEMIKIAGDSALFRALVVTAYEKGRYSTEKYQTRAVSDFANEVYMMCLKRDSG